VIRRDTILTGMAGTSQRIRGFLVEELYWPRPMSELSDDLPLIAEHVIDSMGLLRLVAWLESEFSIDIQDADVVPANFGTIAAIAALVGRIQQTQ
jgi:acyl carrier protein